MLRETGKRKLGEILSRQVTGVTKGIKARIRMVDAPRSHKRIDGRALQRSGPCEQGLDHSTTRAKFISFWKSDVLGVAAVNNDIPPGL